MNLDEPNKFHLLDPDKMLEQIDDLPEQLKKAWALGLSLPLPQMGEVNAVVIAGMGGSAIGADLLSATIADICPVPVIIHRDYGLPAWAKGRGVLAVISSHSGNTEETLSAFDQAVQNHCQVVTVSTGGKLFEKAQKCGFPAWKFEHNGQPRAAVGFSFGLLLALFTRLGLIGDVDGQVNAAIAAMTKERKKLNAESPLSANPAKRLAGQMVGRSVTFFGSGHMVPVARRWKCQVNEVAKTLAAFEALPEADHNTLAGVCFPQNSIDQAMAIFIQSESDVPRNALRLKLTRQAMMVEGLNTDTYTATGASRIEQLWRAVQFGDYVAYYLAMAYETDPTAIPLITSLKQLMLK